MVQPEVLRGHVHPRTQQVDIGFRELLALRVGRDTARVAHAARFPHRQEEPRERQDDDEEPQVAEEHGPERLGGRDAEAAQDVLAGALGEGGSSDADTGEGAVAELGDDDDAEGEEVGGDPAEPPDPSRDVDDEIAGGEDEEYGDCVAEEGSPCKASL